MIFRITASGRRAILFGVLLIAFAAGFSGCKKKTPEDRFADIQALLDQRQFPLAILKMRDLIQESPDAPVINQVRMTLARVYFDFGQKENVAKAIEQLTKVYESEGVEGPLGGEAFEGLVQIYSQMEDSHQKALDLVAAAIEKAAANQDLQESLKLSQARLQLQFGTEEERNGAVKFLAEKMTSAEKPEIRGGAREMLANHYRMSQEFKKSNEVYETYLAKYPEDTVNSQLYMAMGLNSQRAGEKESAEVNFRKGVEMMEGQIKAELDLNKRTELLQQLASFHEQFGDLDKAEETMKRIMSENPRTQLAIQTQGGIASMFAAHQEWDRAREVLERMKSDNPGNQIGQMAEQALQNMDAARKQIEAAKAASADGGTTSTLSADRGTSPTLKAAPR